MTVLRGPADAGHYRVKVGRYGDRWYTDPLPSCPIAEASDWQGPSWSIVKGAAGKDWSFVANKRNAHATQDELERIAKLDPTERSKAFNAINSGGLSQAGGRGTIVHLWAEDLLAGKSPRTISDLDLAAMRLPKAALVEALTYLPALTAFFDAYQPELVAAEYVAINRTLNGVGYGCTPDVAARIQGEVLALDWKSRGADSDHGAYPEEAAQIAAGARAGYMLVADNGGARRALLPEIAGGLVVSIKPDGCRAYPVDIDKAFEHTVTLHSFWTARREEKASIGRAWAPKAQQEKPAAPTPDVDNLRERIAAVIAAGHEADMRVLWPEGVPTLAAGGHTVDQFAALERAVAEVEARHTMPFHPPVAEPPKAKPEVLPTSLGVDNGAAADPKAVDALAAKVEALPPDAAQALSLVAGEANQAGRSLNLKSNPTVRHWSIGRALVAWAQTGADVERLEHAVVEIATVEQCGAPSTGAAISLFTTEQADRLHDTFAIAQANALADVFSDATEAAA